jgi:hypothetical protein
MSDKHIERDVLVELYYNQNLSAPQIADRLSREGSIEISSGHVYNMMKRYNLQRRPSDVGSKMAHKQGRAGYHGYIQRSKTGESL